MTSKPQRFFARSASDNTDDSPFWFVADREKGNLNVTVDILPELRGCLPFLPRELAEDVAEDVNHRERS